MGKHRSSAPGEHRIRVTYDKSDGEGDSTSGWIDEEGLLIELDEFDVEEGVTIAQKAAKLLRREGAFEPSSVPFYPGTWYSTEGQMEYRSGVTESRSFHLDGFSRAEQEEIYKLVTHRGR